MTRAQEWLAVPLLLLCFAATNAEASHWQPAGWYVLLPHLPGPEEIAVDGAFDKLGGPYRSQGVCETARLNLRKPDAHCTHMGRIPVLEFQTVISPNYGAKH